MILLPLAVIGYIAFGGYKLQVTCNREAMQLAEGELLD